MDFRQGSSLAPGIAIGKLFIYKREPHPISCKGGHVPELEKKRYFAAREQAVAELYQIYGKALQEVGEQEAQLFEVHAMILKDHAFTNSVLEFLEGQGFSAEYAVAKTGEKFSEMFAAMDDVYFQARSADVKDLSQRMLSILTGLSADAVPDEPVILAAADLSPSETIQLNKQLLLAFVTRQGSANSHTAILARSMEVPALTDISVPESWNGRPAAVDGHRGILYIDPDEATLARLRRQQEDDAKDVSLLQEVRGCKSISAGGKAIHLYANIAHVNDLTQALANDAEGIGLFRTEFLYLESDHYPTEEEQLQAYRTVAETMAGKRVIIRTLDIGADKQADYFELPKEENPALGLRAIRICLERPKLFKTQLRAILRAAVYGHLAVMFPMIISLEEVRAAKQLLCEARRELSRANIPFGPLEIGIMIETPAAALISNELAQEVDFFSIGTNDLTQYTLAVDRQNPRLNAAFDPHHPALLRLIREIIQNGHAHGIWVGLCGELGADLSLTKQLIELDIDELSVTPSMILPVRRKILNS